MDTLHDVLRSIKGDTRSAPAPGRRDHLTVFREFLDHLDRAAKRRSAPPQRATKMKARRGRK
ncbi:MAG: hypothetical protein KIT76_15465 [Pseudolabrys sp.]|nr:hypothetical protein [Pseudolabrys sp.]